MKKKSIRIMFTSIGILFLSTSTYAAVHLLSSASRGLSFDWRFDEGSSTVVTDSSSRGQGGTLYGDTLPTWVPGRFGRALSFDGVSQYVESDTGVASLGTIDQPYSIATWVKIAPGEEGGNIVHLSNGANGYGWCIPFLQVLGGKFSAISFDGNPVYATESDTPSVDTWHSVVTTWDPTGGLRLYVDGRLQSTTAQTNFAAAGAPVYVQVARGVGGCVADNGFFHGSIDDVRVYSRSLTQAQISALYSSNVDSVATIGKQQSGLSGKFYAGDNFDTYHSSAIDQTINFETADDTIGTSRAGTPDHFTARWTGYITPAYSEDYTFYTVSDDGARLFVNNQTLVNAWVLQGPTEYSGTIHLIAGHRYPIKLEFWENDGGAMITLSWSSNHVTKQIIPSSALSSGSVATINDSRNSRLATNDLLGSWSFDGKDIHWTDSTNGTAYDRSSSNDGTLHGMTQAGSPTIGVIGQALNFNGSSSCITTSAQLFNNPAKFTVTGWVYPRRYANIGFFGQNNSIEFGFDGDGNLAGWTPYGGAVTLTNTSSVVTLNKWHHVAFVGTGTEELLYVDGNQVVTHGGSVLGYGTDTPDTFSIGCNVWNGNLVPQYFDGKLDEVRAYESALTADQVKQLYIMGK